jgi:hypothetical protein
VLLRACAHRADAVVSVAMGLGGACAELQTDVAASRDSNANDGCAGCWGHRDAASKIYALSSAGLSPYGDLFRAGSAGQTGT